MLFCCEALEMFCGLQNFAFFISTEGGDNDYDIFIFG